MEGSEIENFIRVWASIFASVFYCYAVARIVPKGLLRLMMFIPVVCLFLIIPFTLTSIHLGCPTIFFISWLANFKLLLLAFGVGPLSFPSLSLGQFACFACLPIKARNFRNNPDHQSNSRSPKRKLPHLAMKALILSTLASFAPWREHLNTGIFLFMVCMYVYVGLELMLGIAASLGEAMMGLELDTPFNAPHLSTSLRDFWGERWNRMASDILRSAVYEPTYSYASRVVGQQWGLVNALISTFLVSAGMHELILYYLGRKRPTCGATVFFLIHAMFLVVEDAVKKAMKKKKARLPSMSQLLTGPLIFGFTILTFMWLVLPEVVEYNVPARAIGEYAALAQFLKNFTISGTKLVTNVLRSTLIQSNNNTRRL